MRYIPRCAVGLKVCFDGFGGGDTDPMPVGVERPLIPRQASVHLNGYKEADTWSLEFNLDRLPFSPDLIRAVSADIYMFQVDDVNAPLEQYLKDPENLVVTGLMDEGGIELSADGRSITMEGRDYTALLSDRQWDPSKSGHCGRIPVGGTLDKIVQSLVDEVTKPEEHGGFTVTVDWRLADLPPVVGGIGPKSTKRGLPVRDGKSYWDVIYRLVLDHGYIAFVEGLNLVIATPQNLIATEEGAPPLRVTYGRNLSKLKITRRMAKEMTPQIVVKAYDQKTRQTIEARYPENKDEVTTGVGTKKQEARVMVVHGVTDPKALKRLAETAYNHIARGEATLAFETRELRDLEGTDLLRARAGRAVRIGWDPFDDSIMQVKSADQRYAYLVSRGYEKSVAQLVAENYDRVNLLGRSYYAKDIGLEWSADSGLTVTCEAINFISPERELEGGSA